MKKENSSWRLQSDIWVWRWGRCASFALWCFSMGVLWHYSDSPVLHRTRFVCKVVILWRSSKDEEQGSCRWVYYSNMSEGVLFCAVKNSNATEGKPANGQKYGVYVEWEKELAHVYVQVLWCSCFTVGFFRGSSTLKVNFVRTLSHLRCIPSNCVDRFLFNLQLQYLFDPIDSGISLSLEVFKERLGLVGTQFSGWYWW